MLGRGLDEKGAEDRGGTGGYWFEGGRGRGGRVRGPPTTFWETRRSAAESDSESEAAAAAAHSHSLTPVQTPPLTRAPQARALRLLDYPAAAAAAAAAAPSATDTAVQVESGGPGSDQVRHGG